jgi:hypothetical protein
LPRFWACSYIPNSLYALPSSLRTGPRQAGKEGTKQRRERGLIKSVGKRSSVRIFAKSNRSLNTRKVVLALFLGLAVGGIALVGTVVVTQMQQVHAAKPQNVGVEASQYGSVTGGGSPQASRTNEIVPVSECKTLGGYNTEQGSIVGKEFVISDPLPLCINNDVVSSWYALIDVYGGYTPYDGWVCFMQKGDFMGKVCLHWTDMGPLLSCGEEWKLTYSVNTPFELDSNQYPSISGDAVIAPDGSQTIPGKLVFLDYHSFWTGCNDKLHQGFLIISAQRELVFLSSSHPPNSTFVRAFFS